MVTIVRSDEFKKNIDEVMNKTYESEEYVIVSRDKINKDPVVILSLEEFNGWRETLYVMAGSEEVKDIFIAMKRDQAEAFDNTES